MDIRVSFDERKLEAPYYAAACKLTAKWKKKLFNNKKKLVYL
jgi:hypothetical protein